MNKELKGAIPLDDAMSDMYRNHPDMAVAMLNECLEEDDSEMLLITLRQLTKAFGGVAQIAKKTGLNENTLYRTLSRRGNPNLKTLMGITDAMGFRLAFVSKTPNVSPASV